MKGQIRFTSVLLIIVVVVGGISVRLGSQKQYLKFPEALDEVVVTVDGEELLVQDLAFYIAYEEGIVERDAFVYNPENTGQYWKIHTNGVFIRTAAKQTAIDMAIHDEIFYQMAQEDGLTLDEKEEEHLRNTQYDFWSDLEEEQRTAIAVGQDYMNQSIEKMALAEKYQSIYAMMKDKEQEEYAFDGTAYQKLLEEHEVQIHEEVWDRIHFGSITVNH